MAASKCVEIWLLLPTSPRNTQLQTTALNWSFPCADVPCQRFHGQPLNLAVEIDVNSWHLYDPWTDSPRLHSLIPITEHPTVLLWSQKQLTAHNSFKMFKEWHANVTPSSQWRDVTKDIRNSERNWFQSLTLMTAKLLNCVTVLPWYSVWYFRVRNTSREPRFRQLPRLKANKRPALNAYGRSLRGTQWTGV